MGYGYGMAFGRHGYGIPLAMSYGIPLVSCVFWYELWYSFGYELSVVVLNQHGYGIPLVGYVF